MRHLAAAVLGVVLTALASTPRALALGTPVPSPHAVASFRLHDPRLAELSGLAAGIRSPGVLYAQNDGGDAARFFALDARTGRVLARYRVPGAVNHDWEDLAVARDAHGTPSVWIADIGDNEASRSRIELYRVPEPRVDTTRTDVAATTARPQVWRLRYPDGPHDAEALAVPPAGHPFIVTKSLTGASRVFRVPTRPHGRVRTLRPVTTLHFSPTGTPGPYPVIGDLTATGAAVSADGRLLAVRTYSDAYVWHVRAGGVAAALRGPPVRFPLPPQPQGEGICFDAGAVVVDSERAGSAVYRVPVPGAVTGATAAPSSAPPSVPRTAPAAGAQPPAANPAAAGSGIGAGFVGTVVGVAAAVLVGVALVVARRHRGSRS